MTVKLGDGFYPPPDETLESISEYLLLAVIPTQGSTEIDASKYTFVWELTEYDQISGVLLIQVNFTEAIWISVNPDPD